MKIKPFTWYLYEGGKLLHQSGDFNKLLGFTANTTDAKIYYGDKLVWVQNPNH